MILFVYLSFVWSLNLPNIAEGTNEPPLYCFLKISSGERLVGYEVSRILERSTVETCQQECIIYRCTHFSFGDFDNGNGTCELSTDRQTSRRQDPSFDLYVRTNECIQGKPTGYEQACYRRVYSGKRLNEKFIRHSLPCNSLEACQHQCSIEKHFDCQGFNIRLDPDRVGRGICELSSIVSADLDESKDFTFDPEFLYFERVYNNELPNCGLLSGSRFSGSLPSGGYGAGPRIDGGPYYGGDSYGPWSNGYGTAKHGPWGSNGYGSGFYVSNNPTRRPTPQFRPSGHYLPQSDGSGGGHSFQGQGRSYYPKKLPDWNSNYAPHGFFPGFGGGRRYERPNYSPTYIVIDADANKRYGDSRKDVTPPSNDVPDKSSQSPSRENDDKHASDKDDSMVPQSKESDFRNESPTSTMSPSHEPKNLPFPPHDAAMRPHVYPAKPDDLPPKFDSPPREPFYPDGYVSFRFLDNFPPITGREVCFQRAHPGYRLNEGSIRETYDTPTVLDCEAMCTGSPFKCTGYSFRYSSSAGGLPNCLLTDFNSIARTSHLLVDRNCDFYFRMNKCIDLERSGDADCFLKANTNRKIESGKIIKSLHVASISDCELACLTSSVFTCRSLSFRSGGSVIGESEENCLLSDWPVSALTPKDLVASSFDVYERGSYGHGCELDVGPHIIGPGPPFENYPVTVSGRESWTAPETWTHFTVSGWPCKTGTECRLNPVIGFWSCEVEGGDGERWDYCCMPRHSCGYSRGYNYPWCYVGEAGPEQWRPCSDHYFPEFSNRYSYKSISNHNSHPDDSYGPPRDAEPWNLGSTDYLGPPSSWPISYLYSSPPPNETYIWNEDFHDHEHHHLEHDEDGDDSPLIRFKSCNHRFPYPKAVIQKLDLTNSSTTADPDEQILSEGPNGPKKIGYRDATLPQDVDLEADKNKSEINLSQQGNFTEVNVHGKNDSENAFKMRKAKEIVKKIEQIIENSKNLEH